MTLKMWFLFKNTPMQLNYNNFAKMRGKIPPQDCKSLTASYQKHPIAFVKDGPISF